MSKTQNSEDAPTTTRKLGKPPKMATSWLWPAETFGSCIVMTLPRFIHQEKFVLRFMHAHLPMCCSNATALSVLSSDSCLPLPGMSKCSHCPQSQPPSDISRDEGRNSCPSQSYAEFRYHWHCVVASDCMRCHIIHGACIKPDRDTAICLPTWRQASSI